jgi:hypothetical protein
MADAATARSSDAPRDVVGIARGGVGARRAWVARVKARHVFAVVGALMVIAMVMNRPALSSSWYVARVRESVGGAPDDVLHARALDSGGLEVKRAVERAPVVFARTPGLAVGDATTPPPPPTTTTDGGGGGDDKTLTREAVASFDDRSSVRATRDTFARDKDAFYRAFFADAMKDIDAYKGATVSKANMISVVRRGGPKLSLYMLKRTSATTFSWTPIAGTTSFWSTNDLHGYVREHVNEIARDLPSSFNEAYFIINNFDEPQLLGKCPDLQELARLHGNIMPGVVKEEDNVPLWSMSTVRGCFKDLLIPFPDWVGHTKKRRPETSKSWNEREGNITFRGSTTGKGDAQTNMRARSIAVLADEPGFDVGFTAVIQGFNSASVSKFMKPQMQKAEFDNYRFLLDIDGNAHSFHRQLLVAEARAAMVRINVFTDFIAGGLIDGEFCYDIDPKNILSSARTVRDKVTGDLKASETVANALNELIYWMIENDVTTRYLRDMFTRYVTTVKFTE